MTIDPRFIEGELRGETPPRPDLSDLRETILAALDSVDDKTDTHAAQIAAATAHADKDVRQTRAENGRLRAQLATARTDAMREAAQWCTDEADRCDDAIKWGGHRRYVADCKAAAYALRNASSVILALIDTPPAQPEAVTVEQAVQQLFNEAVAEAEKAMRKFPQPNYVISKVAEEAGEVVKAAIHCAEGRETAENVIGEIRQAMAMLIRLYVEGDQVHGLPALTAGED